MSIARGKALSTPRVPSTHVLAADSIWKIPSILVYPVSRQLFIRIITVKILDKGRDHSTVITDQRFPSS